MTAAPHTLMGTGRTELGWCAFCACGEASWGETRAEAHDLQARHALTAPRKAAVGPPLALVVSLAMWAGIARAVRAVVR